MKRVLVTGATGFIGRHSLPSLSVRGYEVHAATSREHAPMIDAPGVVWHRADLMNREQVFALVSTIKPSHLLQLAWYAVPGKFWTSPENLRWVQAGLDLLRAFKEAGG